VGLCAAAAFAIYCSVTVSMPLDERTATSTTIVSSNNRAIMWVTSFPLKCGEIRKGGEVDPLSPCFNRNQVVSDKLPYWSSIRSSEHFSATEGAFGWPFRCMIWRISKVGDSTGKPIDVPRDLEILRVSPDGTVAVWRTTGVARHVVPTRPIWWGLAANTLLYGLMCYALLAIGGHSVRALWFAVKRPPGSCKECGYSLDGNVSGICPECGSRKSGFSNG
jgi:hypothetical protein